MGVKSATEIINNSMTEEDPNKNIQYSEGVAAQKPRWGPEHAGAKELASKYTKGKRLQETVCLFISIGLLIINFVYLVYHFDSSHWHMILLCALLGILTADFASGLVHWGADTWGSVEIPILGSKVRVLYVVAFGASTTPQETSMIIPIQVLVFYVRIPDHVASQGKLTNTAQTSVYQLRTVETVTSAAGALECCLPFTVGTASTTMHAHASRRWYDYDNCCYHHHRQH
ncbi:transmembrane protein 189 [Plakobranchus ocellatus]|uniref:Transmembrane protein 189 n=1 Tax=Plakobranchus ocellatus TaxID=259542 RepID=A0AAV3YAC3_9GAST|nr:transmembrane protein 189 [Plakobranchus ocellatus]